MTAITLTHPIAVYMTIFDSENFQFLAQNLEIEFYHCKAHSLLTPLYIALLIDRLIFLRRNKKSDYCTRLLCYSHFRYQEEFAYQYKALRFGALYRKRLCFQKSTL